MSRIGKKPIPIPKGVTVTISADAVEVQGPKGKMRQAIPPGIVFAQDDGALVAKLSRDDAELGKFMDWPAASSPTPWLASLKASRKSSTSSASAIVRS